MGWRCSHISTSPNSSQSALTGFIPVTEDERGPSDTLNLSLLFNKFGKVPVEIVMRIEVGSVEVGKHQFLFGMCCQTNVGALMTAALVDAD